MTHEAMRAIGSGLGTGGYMVYDDTTDLAAVTAGMSRFLAVESCGQCARVQGRRPHDRRRPRSDRARRGARRRPRRPARAPRDRRRRRPLQSRTQQQVVVGSLIDRFPDAIDAHVRHGAPPSAPEVIAAVSEMQDGTALIDERQAAKQPDWTFDDVDSGQWPADRLDDHREHERL